MGHGMGQTNRSANSPNYSRTKSRKKSGNLTVSGQIWLRGKDLNQRPPGYEPDELPTALPRDIYDMQLSYLYAADHQKKIGAGDRGRTGTIGKDRRILSPVRLPIPPLRQNII